MPPSGFTQSHSRGISSFFSSCLRDLSREGKASRLTPTAAVTREIQNIDADLKKNRRSPAATATLQLIRAFYVELTKRTNPTYDDLEKSGVSATSEIVREIEAIKVEELASV
jgi:hypothetical protein